MEVKVILSNITSYLSHSVAKISKPEPQIKDEDVFDIRLKIKNGDCLVSRTDYELSNVCEKILTGSYWGHAAIYFDGFIYEAVTGGVRKVSFEKFCYMKDGLGLVRLPGSDWTLEQCSIMTKFLDTLIGEQYDYSFDWGNVKKWYCSKLVFKAWEQGDAKEAEAVGSVTILGTKRIIPQNIWDSLPRIAHYGVAIAALK